MLQKDSAPLVKTWTFLGLPCLNLPLLVKNSPHTFFSEAENRKAGNLSVMVTKCFHLHKGNAFAF